MINPMPNYAGGLGVLAVDTLSSLADLGVRAIGVTLVYHQNDAIEYGFNPERYLKKREESVEVEIEDRKVKLVIWQRDIIGKTGHVVPIFFLSAHDPANKLWDRDLTKHLYASHRYTRLGQEVILGIGGVRALEVLGYQNISLYQLNEGHTAFAALELLRRYNYDEEKVRSRVTFTTHTPIAAGHDYFEYELAGKVLGAMLPWNIRDLAGGERLGMTDLAIRLSRSTNSVSKRHQAVCEEMFKSKAIKNVTNGIYHPRWAGQHMKAIFDSYLAGWQENPELFNQIERIPKEELQKAKEAEKEELIAWINVHNNFFFTKDITKADLLDRDTLLVGFARRFVPYKRPDLIFRHLEKLASIGNKRLQLVFANRCHLHDPYCNDLRLQIGEYVNQLRGKIKVVLIPDYDLRIAYKLVAGCDVWLNTPVAPFEASGTSGMKAALNGGLNLSIRDGWWLEGLEREPLAGWGVGGEADYASQNERDDKDADEILEKLNEALHCYYDRREEWNTHMRHAIKLIAYFNTHRLVKEYQANIWSG